MTLPLVLSHVYVTLHGKMDFADVIKVTNHLTLSWEEYPRLISCIESKLCESLQGGIFLQLSWEGKSAFQSTRRFDLWLLA